MADEPYEYQDEITELRQDAEDLLAALSAETFPDDPAVRAVRDRVEQQALQLKRAAAEPITLGVVGEFSVGKSLLLGTLLGRPDLLPVEQRATTGNVTALYLQPGRPGEPTRMDGDAEIHYLTRQELSACVREILDELIRKYEQLPGRSAAELRDYDPIEQGWEKFTAWCRQLWIRDADNPDLLKIPVELLMIRRAHRSCADLLGETVAMKEKLVHEALDLGPTKSLPREFPELPIRPGISRSAVQQDASALEISFPLIRRVSYRVLVDPLVWPLTELTGDNQVVLLDFPGLTATRSAERDAFLSRSELGGVHTIVTVFSMVRPGTNVPHQFYSMLARHGRDRAELQRSILAVGNLFDTVPLPRTDDGPIDFEHVVEASQRLKMFLSNAGDLVQAQDERMTLVSAVRGIGHYEMSFSGFKPEETDRLREALPQSKAAADGWGPIIERLPDGHWPGVLRGFVADGGIDALRGLIERHAAEHGLLNKVTLMRREARRLAEMLPQLERVLAPERTTEADREKALATLRDLFDAFRAAQRYLIQAAREFQDPTKILLADGRPLLDWTRQQAVVSVCEWSSWQEIMQRSGRGFIRKTQPRAKAAGMSWPLNWDDEDDEALGDETTDTFYGPFAEGYRTAVKETRKLISEAVVSWAERHNAALSELRDKLHDPQTRRHLEAGLDRLAALENRRRKRLPALEALADLNKFMMLDTGAAEPPLVTYACGSPVLDEAEISAAYPLFRGTALPWHSAMPEGPGDLDQKLVRHQFYVLRLRRQLVNGLSEATSRRVIGDLARLYAQLRDTLERVLNALPSVAQLRQMFPDDPPPEEEHGGDSPVRRLLKEWRDRDAA